MRLFLTSSVGRVIDDIAKKIETKDKKLVFITTATEGEPGEHTRKKDIILQRDIRVIGY